MSRKRKPDNVPSPAPKGAIPPSELDHGTQNVGLLSQDSTQNPIADYALQRHRQRLDQRKWIFRLTTATCILFYLSFACVLYHISMYIEALEAAPLFAITIGLLGALPTLLLCVLIKGIYAVQTDPLEDKKEPIPHEKIAEEVVKKLPKMFQQ